MHSLKANAPTRTGMIPIGMRPEPTAPVCFIFRGYYSDETPPLDVCIPLFDRDGYFERAKDPKNPSGPRESGYALCPDCEEPHELRWAEAGHVPGWRKCPECEGGFVDSRFFPISDSQKRVAKKIADRIKRERA